MKYEIIGGNLQFVKINIVPGEEIYAEAGKMMFKSDNVIMETKIEGQTPKDFFKNVLTRTLAGESIFMTHYKVFDKEGYVAFAGDFPGKIQVIELKPGISFIAQRDAFICAQTSVKFGILFQKKVGPAFFGGEGFILEKFTGPGIVFIHAGGDFFEIDLKINEKICVDTGCIVGFEESVDYDVEFVHDIKTAIFGGEGLFLATLKGPGKIILQSLTLARLRRELGTFRIKRDGDEKFGLGGLLGSIFGSED
ncbi:MAG: TIGR00266 family protein [Candidatus Omnitrophica bacterium]|nr:TIGR00266 family protein [Candidatus Omnitrophota bacterium]MCM8802964.1 TIGR00266 family protein [Candidatus Omnitrophota bacterium]